MNTNRRDLKEHACKNCGKPILTKSLSPRQWVCIDCRDVNIKICKKKYIKNYRQENRIKLLEKNKEYNKIHKNKKDEYAKQYRITHKEQIKNYNKKYSIKNKEHRNKNRKNRLKNDIEFRILECCRARLRNALHRKRIIRSKRTLDLIGCSLSKLKQHLEKLFKIGMNWQNHGYGTNCWHIDHIIPCDSFDLIKPEEQQKCFHYTNLQPLWQDDNLKKSNNY